jgi:predicted kinase
MDAHGTIFLITGPMAAGKTTVARLLANRFERGVHLEGDLFRRGIVAGRIDMSASPSDEALAQLRLRYRLAAEAALEYSKAGFTVVVEDVVAGPLLEEYVELFGDVPVQVIALVPRPDVVAERAAGREQGGYERWLVADFYEGFISTTPKLGWWLDTTEQTPEETVDEILRRTG